MRRLTLIALLLAACATSPRRHVERAIKAQGGMEALGRIENVHAETKAEFAGMPFEMLLHVRRPMDWRWEVKSPMGTMNIWVLGAVHDAYMSMFDKTYMVEGDARSSTIMHARTTATTVWPDLLLGDSVRLEKAGKVKIAGEKHPAVRAYFNGGSEPITYVFDADTKLIRRVSFRMWDTDMLEWTEGVVDLYDWKEVDGIMLAHRSVFRMGEVMEFEEETTQLILNEELPEGVLDEPAGVSPLPEVGVTVIPESRVAVYRFVGPPDQVPNAISRLMAWIGSNGGQPIGQVEMLYKKPWNYADMSKCETEIQIPVEMERMTRGEFFLGRRKAFVLASCTVEGGFEEAMHHWSTVHEWCKKNGYRRIGARRAAVLKAPGEGTKGVIRIGFPVRRIEASP